MVFLVQFSLIKPDLVIENGNNFGQMEEINIYKAGPRLFIQGLANSKAGVLSLY